MSKLDEISQYVNQLSFDVRAEMLVAFLCEQRVDLSEIMAAFDGQLKRDWSQDIAWSTADRLETGDQLLTLHLNRDGIYDILPEVLFHSSIENESQSGKEMAKDSMKLRTEEKEARVFFQPFENEIFLQRVQLALMENRLSKSVFTEFLMGCIPYFWKIDYDLPEDYVARMKKFLPFVHRITGNLILTAQCLEYILNEMVIITISDEPIGETAVEDFQPMGILGKSILGIDSISGNRVDALAKRILFSIGPIINHKTDERVKDGIMTRFLDCFYGYFVPFEFETATDFIFKSEQSEFILTDYSDTKISCLGYNSVI